MLRFARFQVRGEVSIKRNELDYFWSSPQFSPKTCPWGHGVVSYTLLFLFTFSHSCDTQVYASLSQHVLSSRGKLALGSASPFLCVRVTSTPAN